MSAEILRTGGNMDSIPILDISRFGQGADDNLRFADELGDVFRTIGFVSLVGHDVDSELIERAFGVAREVFVGMTLDQRLQYESPQTGGEIGYTPPEVEVSVGQTEPNRMEYWHIMDPRAGMKNIFPWEVMAFRHTMLDVHAALKAFGQRVLRAIATHLRRDPKFFVRWTVNGENLLRVIRYPALSGKENGPRSGEHEDINLLTVLVPATEPGLQVKNRAGRWIDANNPPGSLIVNLGDMMQMHTFGELKSTTHRVVNPKRACPDRFSMPIFIHATVDQPLVTAGAYKRRRLRDNRVLEPLSQYEIDY